MPRLKGSDSHETYERIVAAAQTLLRRGGAKAVTFRAVADVSGLRVGSINYYFPNRHSLLQACLNPHAERRHALMRQLLDRLEEGGAAAAVLADVADAAVTVAFVQRDLVRLRAVTHAELRAQPTSRPEDTDTRLPHLEELSQRLGKRLGIAPHEVRLTMQTINYALARYGELSDPELCAVCGRSTPEEAREMVRVHIKRCTAMLIAEAASDG